MKPKQLYPQRGGRHHLMRKHIKGLDWEPKDALHFIGIASETAGTLGMTVDTIVYPVVNVGYTLENLPGVNPGQNIMAKIKKYTVTYRVAVTGGQAVPTLTLIALVTQNGQSISSSVTPVTTGLAYEVGNILDEWMDANAGNYMSEEIHSVALDRYQPPLSGATGETLYQTGEFDITEWVTKFLQTKKAEEAHVTNTVMSQIEAGSVNVYIIAMFHCGSGGATYLSDMTEDVWYDLHDPQIEIGFGPAYFRYSWG